jgi:hypothetical protein
VVAVLTTRGDNGVNGGATSMEPLCMFRDRFYAGLGRRAVLARRREGERRFSLSTSVVTTTLPGKCG